MSTLLNSYPIFENNQVLTSAQLNELVAYLDEQNRLTRAKLIGTGIACGLELSLNQSVNPPEITISGGMGITSEGFLITEGDCVMSHCRAYNLPAGARYVPFEDPVTTVQDVQLFELLTDDAPTLPTDVVLPINDPSVQLTNKVVLLFLEILDVDQQSCIGKSCDNNGIERVFNLRRLLISKTDLGKVLARTCVQSGLYPAKYDLPEIFMERALFTNDGLTPNTSNYFVFSQTYVNAMRSQALPGSGTIYEGIFNALRQAYIDFSPLLSAQYNGVNPFTGFPTGTWNNYLNGSSGNGPSYLGMQYFYDFIKDLILAYNEFRDVAFELMSECCTDMDCFPQHLMLGEVFATGTCKPSPYRHYFVTSEIFNNQKEKVARTVSLFQRMVLMVNKFDQATIQNPPTAVTPPNTLAVPIYITPSNEKRDPLSRRAIPYYYRIHETLNNLGTLEQSWNYDFRKKCLFSKGLAPLAYGNQQFDQSVTQGPVATPLFYDLDPYNFLRIEGHIRADVFAAETQIEKIKNDFDLPFNVIKLRLTGDPVDDIATRCEFNDLRTDYGTIRTELTSLLQEMFKRFGVTDREGNISVRPAPQFVKSLVADANTGITNGSVNQPQIGVTTLLNAGLVAGTVGSISIADEAEPISTAGLQARSAAPLASASASLPLYPVYAPQRTIQQVSQKLNTDEQNLLIALNRLLSVDLPFLFTDFKFGYTGTVQDSTPGFIQDYFTALQSAINIKVGYNQLLDLIIRSTRVRNTPELYADLNGYFTEVIGLIERFITSPLYKSLTLLNYELQYRITQLKANDMTLFSNFIKKHPGLEHKAGVKPGGTFILVYPGSSVIDPVRRNFVVNQTREITGIKLENARIMAQDVISVQDKAVLDQNNAILANYQLVGQQLSIQTIPLQRVSIGAHQVVGDFSLPYLCCCDCECDEIPAPTSEGQLNMPALAVPYYAEYSLGDYAFGKDVEVGTNTLNPLMIDIVPMLQYDKSLYQPSQVRLYLVDAYGNRQVFTPLLNERVIPVIATGNYPNVPVTRASTGSVSVISGDSSSKAQQFQYTPDTPGPVTDSFYYMFQVVSNDGSTVLLSSSMGKVTINICKD